MPNVRSTYQIGQVPNQHCAGIGRWLGRRPRTHRRAVQQHLRLIGHVLKGSAGQRLRDGQMRQRFAGVQQRVGDSKRVAITGRSRPVQRKDDIAMHQPHQQHCTSRKKAPETIAHETPLKRPNPRSAQNPWQCSQRRLYFNKKRGCLLDRMNRNKHLSMVFS